MLLRVDEFGDVYVLTSSMDRFGRLDEALTEALRHGAVRALMYRSQAATPQAPAPALPRPPVARARRPEPPSDELEDDTQGLEEPDFEEGVGSSLPPEWEEPAPAPAPRAVKRVPPVTGASRARPGAAPIAARAIQGGVEIG